MRRGALVLVVGSLGLVAAVPHVHAPTPPPPPEVTLALDAPLPDRDWTVKLTNTGTDVVRIVADPRLLSFDVKAAGHELHCVLPGDMIPATDTVRTLAVPPGRSWTTKVNPLLYCFGGAQAAALAPGAEIVARFGWRDARYAPPFVVTPMAGSDGGTGPAREVTAAAVTIAPVQVAPPLDAGVSTPPPPPPVSHPDAYPVHLRASLPDRLDLSSTFEQTVTVTVTNEGERPVRTLLTPQTIGFLIETPNGYVMRCGAVAPLTAIIDLTTTLAPRARTQQAIDFGANCGSVMRIPGLYRVRPRLDTRLATPPVGATSFWNGEVIGAPMYVRVREGEDPLPTPGLDPP